MHKSDQESDEESDEGPAARSTRIHNKSPVDKASDFSCNVFRLLVIFFHLFDNIFSIFFGYVFRFFGIIVSIFW